MKEFGGETLEKSQNNEVNPESDGEASFFTTVEDAEGADEFLIYFKKVTDEAFKKGKGVRIEVKLEK